ncbi:MAG: hypothetical protein CBC35_04985 [Planctomycetes bacterium TMED75]|nr:hypothetical protein [Planctomycetaceae bacterium]OUU93715.1 MAG: hypothetical protein CBC35_04985 [Planctomycetes bacterium TMED75]
MDLPQSSTLNSSISAPALRLTGHEAGGSSHPMDPACIEQLLEEARGLLASLKIDKSRIEARLAEFGRTDPIAEVKGYSALDEAITSCQEAIHALDQSLLVQEG